MLKSVVFPLKGHRYLDANKWNIFIVRCILPCIITLTSYGYIVVDIWFYIEWFCVLNSKCLCVCVCVWKNDALRRLPSVAPDMREMLRSMSIVSDASDNFVSADDYLQPQIDDTDSKQPLHNVRLSIPYEKWINDGTNSLK